MPYDKDKKQRPQRGQEEKIIKASTPTGTDKADMVLVRPWVKWTEIPYEPEANPDVQKYVNEQLNNTPPDEMALKTVVEQMVLRPPQELQLQFPGHEPLNLFNWHAPQDGTSVLVTQDRMHAWGTRSMHGI
ncbi:MAG: hypothetical protein IT167_20610 [Bryobacterales bacterium]|nr:hypothetical protein [Bryobacterales bacterium]